MKPVISDGGILDNDGVVDVFSALRLLGEASFAGGVFAVARTGDPVTWEILRGKGHVVLKAFNILYENGTYEKIMKDHKLDGNMIDEPGLNLGDS